MEGETGESTYPGRGSLLAFVCFPDIFLPVERDSFVYVLIPGSSFALVPLTIEQGSPTGDSY